MLQAVQDLERLHEDDVRKAYRRWAPMYDAVFGRLVKAGIEAATRRANQFAGKALDVGVGTGLSLPRYGQQLRVTGTDLSADMLMRARRRAEQAGCRNVEALLEMDAAHMTFKPATFDVAVAMFVLTVVPDPRQVVEELARVTMPGGRVIIVNHFSVDGGLRGSVEKGLAKHAAKLGWRPEFPVGAVLMCKKLRLVSMQAVKPMGFFTLLEFRRIG